MLYQSSFDTVAGVWIDVKVPFSSFIAVRQTKVDYTAPPLYQEGSEDNSANIGFILSKFEYNSFLNPRFTAGGFKLDVSDICFYRDPRPAFVLISSAGAERINRLTDDQRQRDVPIVQLNPKVI